MRLKTAVIVFLVAAATLVGGSMLYTRSQAKKAVEDIITVASPYAEITYRGISVTLGGKIRIQNIEIRTRLIAQTIPIEGIDIETPGLWFLLTSTGKLRDGKLPDHMRLLIRGLTFNLDGALADALEKITAAARRGSGAADGDCGPLQQMTLRDYRKLGYQAFVLDLGLGYRLDKSGNSATTTVEWRAREMASLDLSMQVMGLSKNVMEMVMVKPHVSKFSVVYTDLSLTDRIKRFCAEANSKTVVQYTEMLANRGDDWFQQSWGFVPGTGLRDAYRSFVNEPREVRVEGMLPDDFSPQTLALYKPEDIVGLLGLRVSVNGKSVKDLSTSTFSGTPAETPRAAVAGVDEKVAATTTEATPPTVQPAAVETPAGPPSSTIPIKELGRHVGKMVRIIVTPNTVREGLLVQVGDGMARIERRYAGGSMVIAIPVGHIERAELMDKQ